MDKSQEHNLYWAVVEHVRTWLLEDGPFLLAINKNGGKFDVETLTRISISYNVNRSMYKKKEKCSD